MGRALRAIAICAVTLASGAACVAEDSCPPFTHIVGGDFGRTGQTLWWTMQVEQLPDMITFNEPAVPANFLEYRWAIDVDSDRDGAADLRAAIEHFAATNGMPMTTSDILSGTSADLWQVMGAVASTVGSITASVDPSTNTFRFETTTAAAPGLVNVSDRAQSTWTTVYRFGADVEDQCEETWR
jgi:Tfp pilus assembly PilM family ATPase